MVECKHVKEKVFLKQNLQHILFVLGSKMVGGKNFLLDLFSIFSFFFGNFPTRVDSITQTTITLIMSYELTQIEN